MGQLSYAAGHTDQADLLLLANVETIRDQLQPATATAVASLIGGAPPRQVAYRLAHLTHLGALEFDCGRYQLSEMGAELLRQELHGWTPSRREEERREYEVLHKVSVRVG